MNSCISAVNNPVVQTVLQSVSQIALAAGVMNDLDNVWRQRTNFRLYSACVMTVLLYGSETLTLNKHVGISYAMSAQNPLSQVERLRMFYSGCHIWLGHYHQHTSCSPMRIIRPRRQIQSSCSSVQHPLYLLCFWRWISIISSWPFLEALKWTT